MKTAICSAAFGIFIGFAASNVVSLRVQDHTADRSHPVRQEPFANARTVPNGSKKIAALQDEWMDAELAQAMGTLRTLTYIANHDWSMARRSLEVSLELSVRVLDELSDEFGEHEHLPLVFERIAKYRAEHPIPNDSPEKSAETARILNKRLASARSQ